MRGNRHVFLKAIYCRLFQICFRLALPVPPYREPNPLYPVPRLMDRKELEEIYFDIGDWSDRT